MDPTAYTRLIDYSRCIDYSGTATGGFTEGEAVRQRSKSLLLGIELSERCGKDPRREGQTDVLQGDDRDDGD